VHEQVDQRSQRRDPTKCAKIAYFTQTALSPELQSKLGGWRRSEKLLDRCKPDDSGKMQALQKLLSHYVEMSEKTLVFSMSTRVLDIIEDFLK
jgi:SNF2 family DNA or RNA helicase